MNDTNIKKSLSFNNDLFPLLKLIVPLALTGVAQSSNFFFQTLFLAHVSQDVLAASALAGWLFATLVVISFGTMSAINVLTAHKHGADDVESISLVLRDGLLLAVVVTIPAFLLVWNMSPIFLLFGQHPSIVLLAESYLHALAWSLLPNLIMVAFLEFLIGIGHARAILFFTLLNVSLNIVLSYLLIFGKLGLPLLGIAGAGWGTTISCCITAITLVIYVLSNHNFRSYCQSMLCFQGKSYLWELIKLGVPMGTMFCFEVGFFLALTLLMGTLGPQWLAANQVTMQYMGSLMGVIFAVAQAITVRMGYLLGKKEFHSAKQAAYLGVSISAIAMIMVAICYWTMPYQLIAIDFDSSNLNNLTTIKIIKNLFIAAAIFQLFEATRISLFGALRALKDTRFTLWISILSFWGIALPVGYLLAKLLHWNGSGLWWGMVMGAFTSVILLYRRFKSKIDNTDLLQKIFA